MWQLNLVEGTCGVMVKLKLSTLAKVFLLWILLPLVVAALILWIAATGAEHIAGLHTSEQTAGWAQAIGAVLAIVAGFVGNAYQLSRQQKEALNGRSLAGRAAYLLAYDAFEIVSDRLESALQPNKSRDKHALRGARTTEMVAAMREFETSRVPDDMLADYIRLRSRLVAINERITEIYESEERAKGNNLTQLKARRLERLQSAVRARKDALQLFTSLETVAVHRHRAVSQSVTKCTNIENYPDTARPWHQEMEQAPTVLV
jgi:hypothetical protein